MLTGHNIFITGGGSGIGLATAKLAVSYGAKVTIMDISRQNCETAKKEIGNNCWFYVGDVANSGDVAKAFAYAVESMGLVDGALNNAGVNKIGAIYELTDEAFETTIKICLYGTMYCMREESSYMVKNEIKGSIVNTSSMNSMVPYRTFLPYCTAKGGIDQMTRAACMDLGQYGIRVNAVCPGFVDTPLSFSMTQIPELMEEVKSHTPLGRWCTPEEIGEVICFLLSDKASYMTGELVSIDGGTRNAAYPDTMKHLRARFAARAKEGK